MTCGVGTQTRTIQCLTANGESSIKCDNELKPIAQKTCNAGDCPGQYNIQNNVSSIIPFSLPSPFSLSLSLSLSPFPSFISIIVCVDNLSGCSEIKKYNFCSYFMKDCCESCS